MKLRARFSSRYKEGWCQFSFLVLEWTNRWNWKILYIFKEKIILDRKNNRAQKILLTPYFWIDFYLYLIILSFLYIVSLKKISFLKNNQQFKYYQLAWIMLSMETVADFEPHCIDIYSFLYLLYYISVNKPRLFIYFYS